MSITNENTPVVSVIVITYNAETTIAQTIESIVAQKTDYPFEIIIGEDCSPDNTYSVCQQYAAKHDNITLIRNSSNLGLVHNWINCLNLCKGKYVMNCAGDDYWHNPNKIQLQVDFMEANPNCVACHTEIDVYNETTKRLTPSYKREKGLKVPQGKIQKEILAGRDHISAVTLCYRKSVLDERLPKDKFIELKFPREDWPTLLIVSAYGDIMYLPVSTATYRVGIESVTRTSDYGKIAQRLHRDKIMTEYLYSLFPEWGPFKDGPYFDNIKYHQMMLAAYRNNDYKYAKKFANLDCYPTTATRMAQTYVSFKLYRLYKMKQ